VLYQLSYPGRWFSDCRKAQLILSNGYMAVKLFSVASDSPFGYSGSRKKGVVVSRWMPRSSKPVAGRAERAVVGSTPIHSRLFHLLPPVKSSPQSYFIRVFQIAANWQASGQSGQSNAIRRKSALEI
jgi:hypothetical protein